MMMRYYIFAGCFWLLAFMLGPTNTYAKSERQLVREGNAAYATADFALAETQYLKSLSKHQQRDLDEARFNLGDAYYKQERYEQAAVEFSRLAAHTLNDKTRALAYHNLGNAHLKAQKLEECIEAYKKALRVNPQDDETRYNLAYALLMQKQQEEQEQQQEQNQEQNQEQQEQEENQEQEEQEQNEEQQENQEQQQNEQQEGEEQQENQEQQQNEQQEGEEQEENQEQQEGGEGEEQEGEENKQQQSQPQEGGEATQVRQLTKEEAIQLLESLKNEEMETAKRVMQRTRKGRDRRIDKDW